MEFDSAFPADREAFEVVEQGEGVLDAGANLAVRAVVLVFPGREFSSDGCAAVRDEQAGAAVAAVGGDRGGGRRRPSRWVSPLLTGLSRTPR